MEADWEFEIGGDAPVIEPCWAGFVDLRAQPELAARLPEAVIFPALAEALARLNAHALPVYTSKCDYFPSLAAEEFDAGELDASPADAVHAAACYIDLLPSSGLEWGHPDRAAEECKRICTLLRSIPLRCCRADLVVRRFVSSSDLATLNQVDLGVTAYLTACGPTREAAAAVLSCALAALAASVAQWARNLAFDGETQL